MTSASFETAREKSGGIIVAGAKITFPAFGSLPVKNFHFGTTDFEVDDEEYRVALRDIPMVRTQRGLGQDKADFVVNDAKSAWYEQIKPYENVLEDSQVIIKECLLTEDGIFESEITHNGVLDQFSLSDSDNSLRFSSISDMSRPGFQVGAKILTQRYCAAVFNVNGLKDPQFDPCGWTTAQGGNPLYCTHKLKGLDGCEDHNNSHRIVAVEGLTTADVQIVAGGGLGGGGWEYGGNPCFGKHTLIWMADGTYKPIYKIRKGDIVWSFTPAGELVRARVGKIFRHKTNQTLVMDFGNGRFLETTKPHYFLIGKDRFKEAGLIEPGESVRVNHDSQWFEMILRNKGEINRIRRVWNFHVDRWQTYFVVVDGRKIAVHNSKNQNYQEYYQ